jgi:hypothetical protein
MQIDELVILHVMLIIVERIVKFHHQLILGCKQKIGLLVLLNVDDELKHEQLFVKMTQIDDK